MEADAGRVDDHGGILRDGTHYLDDRSLLIAELTQRQAAQRHRRVGAHLAGEIQGRHRVVPLPEHPRHGVGPSGPARHAHHAGAPRDAGVAFGGDRASLFVVTEHELQIGSPPERVIQMHGAAAGDHEHVAHAQLRDAAGNVLGDLDHLCLTCRPAETRDRSTRVAAHTTRTSAPQLPGAA